MQWAVGSVMSFENYLCPFNLRAIALLLSVNQNCSCWSEVW
jgi:hypothetical protein